MCYSFFLLPITALIDSLVLHILEGQRELYGKQRLWGNYTRAINITIFYERNRILLDLEWINVSFRLENFKFKNNVNNENYIIGSIGWGLTSLVVGIIMDHTTNRAFFFSFAFWACLFVIICVIFVKEIPPKEKPDEGKH